MKQIPIKKYEKLSTMTDKTGTVILTKITDFKNKTVTFEVKNNGHKHVFKTLKEAQNHLKKTPQATEKGEEFKKQPFTQATLNF
jgi:hypothetical protein